MFIWQWMLSKVKMNLLFEFRYKIHSVTRYTTVLLMLFLLFLYSRFFRLFCFRYIYFLFVLDSMNHFCASILHFGLCESNVLVLALTPRTTARVTTFHLLVGTLLGRRHIQEERFLLFFFPYDWRPFSSLSSTWLKKDARQYFVWRGIDRTWVWHPNNW